MTSAVPLRGSCAFHLAQPRACLALLVLTLGFSGASADAAREIAPVATAMHNDVNPIAGELPLLFPLVALPLLQVLHPR